MIRKALTIASLALFTVVAGFAAAPGCLPAGYASCQNDNDCPTRDGGKLICYNLRCVECHYDDNCPAGSVCSSNNTCQALHTPDKEEGPAPPPTSLEECAKRCKGNEGCGASCRDQFK
jgi:hypothetical protein